MRNNKSWVCLILCLLLFLQVAVINVEAEGIQPRYTYISAFGATLTTNSSKTMLTISADLQASVLSTVVLRCYIQCYEDGYWRDLHGWYENGSKVISLDATYEAVPNYTYRLLVRGFVYNSDGTLIDSENIYQYVS